jgi:hypothetical protein
MKRIPFSGVLIRGTQGLVTAALSNRGILGRTALQAHARVALGTSQFAHDIGIRRIVWEIGCPVLVGLVNSDGPCLAPDGNLVNDVHIVFRSNHSSFLNFYLLILL